MGTTGTIGSMGLGLALTGIGVVGPFTMTCPGERVGEGQGRLGRACVEGRSEGGWAWGWGTPPGPRVFQLDPVLSRARASWVQAVGT